MKFLEPTQLRIILLPPHGRGFFPQWNQGLGGFDAPEFALYKAYKFRLRRPILNRKVERSEVAFISYRWEAEIVPNRLRFWFISLMEIFNGQPSGRAGSPGSIEFFTIRRFLQACGVQRYAIF